MLPQCKPVVALITLSGAAFGGEAGFLVGALTGFVSNLFFTQGPWTPWQMFALGLIGFLAGALFRKGPLRRDRISLALYGGFAAFFLYGGIMNFEMALMYQPQPTGAMFLAVYLSGLPFDLIHAAATVIFLLILSEAMLTKLDRIKIKYGLIEL
ncbi:MAG: ECF transporter S component [Oscillospiraceae bacterium]|nr:ECF transporter S component [Oscillospiraceae bacterium]